MFDLYQMRDAYYKEIFTICIAAIHFFMILGYNSLYFELIAPHANASGAFSFGGMT
jgi:hypothetical protein